MGEGITLISVVMSVYKEPVDWLIQSIDSILMQTLSDFEFIIICDNPSYGEGIEILNKYAEKNKRIKLIFNDENIGLTKSLNKGLAVASGKYIARMDADDISMPERFEKQIAFMENHPNIGVCGSNIIFFGEKTGEKNYPLEMSDIWLFIESPFAHPSVMIRKEALGDSKYDENCIVSQDFNLWVELYSKGVNFANVDAPLLRYRYSGQQIMSTKANLQIEISKQVRRKALKAYYEKKGLNCNFIKENWRIDFANRIIKDLELQGNDDVKKQIIYYSFLSIDKSMLYILYALLFRGYLFRMCMTDVVMIMYFKLRGIDYSKF